MWVEQLPSGKYRMVERYTDPMTGKQKKVSVTTDRNTPASRKSARETLAEKIEKKRPSGAMNRLTFSELVEKWREYQKITVKKSTYKRNYFAGETLIRTIGPDVLVDLITAGYVMDRFLATGKKPGTLNEYLRRFKSIMRWGYKTDHVKDVAYLEKLEPFKDEEKIRKLSEKFLEASEVKTLISGMKKEAWQDLTQFLVLTGLRCGEAFALTDQDIDLKERVIHVTKTLDMVNNVITSPKTRTSVRDVFIQDELLSLCRKLRGETMAKRLIGGNGMIFQDNYFAYAKYFRENTERLLGRSLTPHCLRHTHVALLAENGMPLDMISRRLGHQDSRITREVYFHVTEKLKEKENRMLQKVSIL